MTTLLEQARAIAASVTDPELPMLSLADLGVLRSVAVVDDVVEVAITPTYSGCPAMATMRDDLVHRLQNSGFSDVRVRVSLDEPWTSDWITENGRKALQEHGISAPTGTRAPQGPIPLTLTTARRSVRCPQCGSAATSLISEFGSTSCKAIYRCTSCDESFDHIKEI